MINCNCILLDMTVFYLGTQRQEFDNPVVVGMVYDYPAVKDSRVHGDENLPSKYFELGST